VGFPSNVYIWLTWVSSFGCLGKSKMDEISEVLSSQSAADLEQLADDINYYMKYHPSSIDQELMASVLYSLPEYLTKLSVPDDSHPSKRIRLDLPSTPSPLTPPKGLTPGEERLWTEQARIRPEEGETLLVSKDSQDSREPKFFNRIKAGFLWTEYNRLHYSEDNPPPTQILGYKFNIFYPDLKDPLKTPTYTLTPGKSGPNTLTLVFTAGAPYDPVEFQIVNKEWETSHRLGFKCVFERGALQLYFLFKKDAIRR